MPRIEFTRRVAVGVMLLTLAAIFFIGGAVLWYAWGAGPLQIFLAGASFPFMFRATNELMQLLMEVSAMSDADFLYMFEPLNEK